MFSACHQSFRGPRLFADAVWLALAAGLVAFVARFGVNLPYMDEWPMVDALASSDPPIRWLWERHNEHLLVVPRFLFWGLFRLTDDLRTGMFVSAIGWAVLARVLMAAARFARGRPAYTDAAFPLLLMHWGQYENVLMSYQLCFMLSALLAGLTMALMSAPMPGPWRVLAIAGCTALLPLCGGHGLLFAGAGIVWLIAVAADRWVLASGRTEGRAAVAAIVGLSATAATVALYAVIPATPPTHTAPITGWNFLFGWFGFKTAGYGLAAERLWPWAAVVPAVVAVAVGLCAWKARKAIAGPDRVPYLSLGAAAACSLLLAVAVAWGRARFGLHAVFFPRYVGLAALMPAVAILFWLRFGGPRLSRYGPAFVAVSAAGLLPGNLWYGWKYGSCLEQIQTSAGRELAAGVPIEVVARKYHFLIYNDSHAAAGFIQRYANIGIGPFQQIVHEPLAAVVPLPVTPTRVRDVRPIGENGWANTSADGCIEYDLPTPALAYAVVVRGRYRYPGFWPPATARVEWWPSSAAELNVQEFPVFRFPTPDHGDPALIVWVNGPVGGFRIVPDRRSWGFQVTSVELLAPLGPVTTNAPTEDEPALMGR